MSIRPATELDLEAIVWIALAALPDDPGFQYRFPYLQVFSEDHANFLRIRYREWMAASDRAVMVFESPIFQDPSVEKPVAFSVWQLPGSHCKKDAGNGEVAANRPSTKSPADNLERRDANLARMIAFRLAVRHAKGEWFDGKYGQKQLHLAMLACHPTYQKRGAGEALCRWGLEKGKAEGLTLTLFASPMGARLYRRLGFRDVASFRTQVDGEEEYVDTPGMVLAAQDIR